MTCLVQGNVEDLAEVDRVRSPELIGTTQLRDRNPVSQGDASECVVWRDLQSKNKIRYVSAGAGGRGGKGDESTKKKVVVEDLFTS
jgi:hypothetical protein